jgi:hypothetical protein
MPPTDFCSRVFPEHTLKRPTPQPHNATANRCAIKWQSPLAGYPPTELLQARGRFGGRLGHLNPHHDDRSPQWIYPNLIVSGTSLSRARVVPHIEECWNTTTVRLRSPWNELAQQTLPK